MKGSIWERFKSLFPDLGNKIITLQEKEFDEIMTVCDNTKVSTGHGIMVDSTKEEKKGGQ